MSIRSFVFVVFVKLLFLLSLLFTLLWMLTFLFLTFKLLLSLLLFLFSLFLMSRCLCCCCLCYCFCFLCFNVSLFCCCCVEWLIGIIKPIFKNKGDPTQPENYRPITLLSCLGKLFTCILSKRLDTYASEINLITSSQAGFRKNHSTLDHILTLQFLSNTLLCRKKKLFCAFVDFKQAFDTVWRNGLWYKLLDNGIGGKCYAFIRNMYKGMYERYVI